jgi:hypothetical protein
MAGLGHEPASQLIGDGCCGSAPAVRRIANELASMGRRRPVRVGVQCSPTAPWALIAKRGNLTDVVGKTYDHFKIPEAFVLAETTAKSAFSERLAQRAWRRLIWSDNFRAPGGAQRSPG